MDNNEPTTMAICLGVILGFVLSFSSISFYYFRYKMWKLAKKDDPELANMLSIFNSTGWMTKVLILEIDLIVFLYWYKKCKTDEIEKYRTLMRRSFTIMIITFIICIAAMFMGYF